MVVKVESYAFAQVGRFFESFETLGELREEVGRYFTKSEQHIADRLCDFSHAKFDACGMATNSYRSYSVTAYLQ